MGAVSSKSVPRNPLLFSILYRMRLVEQIGSGIRRIRDACEEHGVAEPDINVSADWFTVTFLRQEVATQHVTRKLPHKSSHMSSGLFQQFETK